MNSSLRRATPDSEALASSEDEKPWPSAPSFGGLSRKENSVAGFGGSIWSTQKRGSFGMVETAQRNALRESRLGAPGQPRSGLRNDATPSPSASEGSAALPFPIPLHPAPKAGRSMSHSQGQREGPHQGDHAPALPLGLLAEEVDTESESELGGGLTHTTSHPPIGTLHRTATFPATYDSYYAASNGKDYGEAAGAAQGGQRGDRRFEAAFATLALAPEASQRRSQWQTHLGWDDVPNVNESRRHSLADIPTRRGSLVGGTEPRNGSAAHFWPDSRIYDWEGASPGYNDQQYADTAQLLKYGANIRDPSRNARIMGSGGSHFIKAEAKEGPSSQENIDTIDVPQAYRLNQLTLPDQDRVDQTPVTMSTPQFGNQRPRKLLYIVSFKCARVDVFYLLDNTGLDIKEGDIVIVEADRGQDLGTVQHAQVTPDDARNYKRRYGEEQYKWLMMFSKHNNKASVNPNTQVYGEDNRSAALNAAVNNAVGRGMSRDNFNNLKPKAIKRLANSHEIKMLAEKEGNEAKAKRTCQQKVAGLILDMEILDAEWQWDFQKLIFYYYADHYINFKDLITELYRIYKTRIWLSAINPASFSQHALGSPPSGIGPGALSGQEHMDAYSTTGQDPDPYGAVPPYQIGYDTYTPNYPAIPGVLNSFHNAPRGSFIGGSQLSPLDLMPTYNYGHGSYNMPPSAAPPTMNTNPFHGGYGYAAENENSNQAGQFASTNTYNPGYGMPPSEPIPIHRPPPAPSSSKEEQRARAALLPGRPPGAPRGDGFDRVPFSVAHPDVYPFGDRPRGRAPPPLTAPTSDRITGGFGPRAFAAAPDFVPHMHRAAWTQTPPSFPQVPQAFPQVPPTFGQAPPTFGQAPPTFRGSPPHMRFGAPGSENDGKAEVLASFLDSLQNKEETHADAMSRER